MANNSKIEWTDATWNPVRGCTKISPGCKHCYAETFAERFRGVKGHPYEQGFDLRLVPEKLTEPFAWRSPKLVFVNSMSDLFQPGVPDEYVGAVSQVMAMANWHTYQVLTKRSERLRDLLTEKLQLAAQQDNIWWGVSVEDRKFCPGSIISGSLLRKFASSRLSHCSKILGIWTWPVSVGVIVGGESGPGARPMRREWVISIRKQCRMQGVPFFFKQWGGVRKKNNGRLLDGRTYDEYPERRAASMPDKSRCIAIAKGFLETFRSLSLQNSLVQVLT